MQPNIQREVKYTLRATRITLGFVENKPQNYFLTTHLHGSMLKTVLILSYIFSYWWSWKKIWAVQSPEDNSKMKFTAVRAQDGSDCRWGLQSTCLGELFHIPWRSSWCSAGLWQRSPAHTYCRHLLPLGSPCQLRLPRTKLMTGERGKIKFAKVLNI